MSLAPGSRLGVFEIVSALGAGGMGEVYRAVDTRLKRQVAVKILPESLAMDSERLSRLQREAELLASLNHPNIAAIYGIENTSAGKALVMELVEGIDLRERIGRGAVPPADAMALASQLAHAIAAAHARGIVHRDLKPGNIRLRDDGTIKVLDFGLAKAAAGDRASDVTATATRDGVIMGTPRYMSPEQARGETAGMQSDIWAFGVVFYEMLTRRSPFDASTSVEILSRVLNDEPDFQALPADLPPRITLLLQRCLRKSPAQRLHHIGDAALEIDEATLEPSAGSPPRTPARGLAFVAAAAIAALIGVGTWTWFGRNAGGAPHVVRSEITAPAGQSILPIGVRRVAMSRDGQRIAIATGSALYIRRLDERDFVAIPFVGVNPFFSRDGQSVAFFDATESGAGLKIVSVAGGTPKLLVPTAERSAGGDWREDGTIVFATGSGIYLVRDDGTQLRTLAKPDAADKQRILSFPQFLPQSNAVLFTITSTESGAAARLARVDLETSAIDVVLHGGSSARYLPDGRLIFAARDRLKAVAFDPQRPSVTADSAVDTGVEIVVALDNGAADFALSDAGDMIYLPPSSKVQLLNRLAWVDRQGRKEPIDLPARSLGYPRVSPDGSRIVMDSSSGGNRDVWIYDLRQRRMSQLTFGPTEDNQPVWSRDGTRVFFASDRTGDFDIYSRAADGATGDRLEFAGPRIQFPNSVTPDGTGLFVLEDYVDTGLLRFPRPQRVERVLQGPASKRLAELSPDGKWLAYESTETGPPQVFVRPFPDVSNRREQISASGGRYPLWNPVGHGELFFVTAEGQMMAAALDLQSLVVRRLTKLFDTIRPPPGLTGRPYDVSPVDGRFLMSEPQVIGDNTATRFNLIVNWGATLRPQ